jgi:hypothetical protein
MTLARAEVSRLKPPPTFPVSTIVDAKRALLAADDVEVSTDDGAFPGRVVQCDETTLVLRIAPEVEAEILVEDIRRIDRVSRRGVEGAAIGASAGAVPLAMLSWAFGDWAHSGSDYYWMVFAVFALPVVGGLGAIGGIIGLAIRHRQPIYVAPGST